MTDASGPDNTTPPADTPPPAAPEPAAAPPAYDAPPPAAPEPVAAPPAAAPDAAPPVYAAAPPPAAAPQAAPPAYGAAPAYAGPPPTDVAPGKTLGIVALVVVFFFSLVGLILGYVARSQSKSAGIPNTPAKVAIILGWIFLVLGIIITVIIVATLSMAGNALVDQLCQGMEPGIYELTDGSTITCP